MGYNKNGEIVISGINRSGYSHIKVKETPQIELPFNIGDKYLHPIYGVGKITDIDDVSVISRFKIGHRLQLVAVDKAWLAEKISSGIIRRVE